MKTITCIALTVAALALTGCSKESKYESRLQEAGLNEAVVTKMVEEFRKAGEETREELYKIVTDDAAFKKLQDSAKALNAAGAIGNLFKGDK